MIAFSIGAAVRRALRCGGARLAPPARAVATLGLALAILASLALVVPRNEVHAAPPGEIRGRGGVHDEVGRGSGVVELPGTRKGLPIRTSLGFLNARLPWRFQFPRDHAAHFSFQSEWWYFTGLLYADDGRRFGYELTFFRYGLRPGDPPPPPGASRWRGNQVYPAHLALTDERCAREALGMGRASERVLDVAAGDWHLHGSSPFRLHAATERVTLDLSQT